MADKKPKTVSDIQDSLEEKIYFDDGYNKITSKRVILGVNTYVLNNISSVSVHENNILAVPNPAKGCLFLFGGIFALGGIFGLIGALGEGDVDALGPVFVMGLIGGAIIYAGTKAPGGTAASTEYSVRVGSNAGEVDGCKSQDQAKMQEIVDAINNAIVENQ